MDYSDTKFIEKFRQPATYNTPDGESWRLFSLQVMADAGKSNEIIVGYAMKAPWKAIKIPSSVIGDVDAALKREADKIAASLSAEPTAVGPARNGFSADGFQVVNSKTKRVVQQGPWVPAFLPKGTPLPAPGFSFYTYDDELYIAQTDTSERLLATSFVQIGGIWWMVCSCVVGFVVASIIARALSRKYLRNYFAMSVIRVPDLEEAIRTGEGQSVEFKRGMSDDENRAGSVEEELLKSIAAFANTNDGVIFVGIDDAGHVKGLGLDFTQKDRLERKINQLVRNRIRPTPPVQIMFQDMRGFVIARIAVARGEAPAYMIGGTIYVRHGSSDVQAQPEDMVRLVSQYAF